MRRPEELIREAEDRLTGAGARLTHLEGELTRLEREVEALEHEVPSATSDVVSPWASVRAGLAPPLAMLGAALFFDQGVWPLGLLASVSLVVQVLLLPRLNRSRA